MNLDEAFIKQQKTSTKIKYLPNNIKNKLSCKADKIAEMLNEKIFITKEMKWK